MDLTYVTLETLSTRCYVLRAGAVGRAGAVTLPDCLQSQPVCTRAKEQEILRFGEMVQRSRGRTIFTSATGSDEIPTPLSTRVRSHIDSKVTLTLVNWRGYIIFKFVSENLEKNEAMSELLVSWRTKEVFGNKKKMCTCNWISFYQVHWHTIALPWRYNSPVN